MRSTNRLPYPLLLTLAGTALPLFGCHEDPVIPTDQVCITGEAQDRRALDAWLAQPLKTCALDAIFPARTALVHTQASAGNATGWDRERVLDGADGNGVRVFDRDGTSFAAFDNFVALAATAQREQELGSPDVCADAEEPTFSARVELGASTCTVIVDGEVVFSAPLFDQMDVPLAWWPQIRRQIFEPTPQSNLPRLNEGFEYVNLPRAASPASHLYTGETFEQLGAWLGVTSAQVAAHTQLPESLGPELLTLPDLEQPPIVLGDDLPAIVSTDEARALTERGGLLPALWHYSGAFERSTDTDSVIERGAHDLRYVTARPRNSARAAADAAACFGALVDRASEARVVSAGQHAPSISNATIEGCARLTSDLVAALASDESALARVLFLYSDEARLRFGDRGPAGDLPIFYLLRRGVMQDALAQAIVAGAPAVAARAPSVVLDHALASWSAFAASPLLLAHPELARPLAIAALRRADRSFELIAYELAGLAPISASDVAALVEELAATPGTLSPTAVNELIQRIARPE